MKRCIIALVILIGLVAAGCGHGSSSKGSAKDQSQRQSDKLQGQIYQSAHNIEFRNYNLRQRISDDPSTIIWCTFFPPQNGQDPITVPIAGKLTSSNKRPYDNQGFKDRGQYTFTPREIPGPDHMFGSSSEYRYGFDPTLGIYYDFTNLPSMCTTAPTVFQQNQTRVVIQTSTTLGSLDRAAQVALKAGNAKEALRILKQAETKR